MPKATDDSSNIINLPISRRALLCAAPALALVPPTAIAALPPAALAADPEPFIALYAAWQRAEIEHGAAVDRHIAADEALFDARDAGLPDGALVSAADEAFEESSEACGAECDALKAVVMAPAQGAQGVLLKLWAAATRVRQESDDDQDDPAYLCVLALVEDVQRLWGVAL